MTTVDIKATKFFSEGLAGLIHGAKLNAKLVVKHETGQLSGTLARTSPPQNPAKTRKTIDERVHSRFEMLRDESNSQTQRLGGYTSESGIHWYRVDSNFLRGVAPKEDKRGASVEELRKLYYKISKKGRISYSFRNRNTRQRVLLYQTILTKESTVKKLAVKLKSHIGRLRAGWLVSVARGAVRFSGPIPSWVKRHIGGARGSFIDGTADARFPRFTIINTSKGIGQKQVAGIIRTALHIRGKAMAKNALTFMSGKKRLADYAKTK